MSWRMLVKLDQAGYLYDWIKKINENYIINSNLQ